MCQYFIWTRLCLNSLFRRSNWKVPSGASFALGFPVSDKHMAPSRWKKGRRNINNRPLLLVFSHIPHNEQLAAVWIKTGNKRRVPKKAFVILFWKLEKKTKKEPIKSNVSKASNYCPVPRYPKGSRKQYVQCSVQMQLIYHEITTGSQSSRRMQMETAESTYHYIL